METRQDIFWGLLETEHERARAYCHKLTGDPNKGDDLYHDALFRSLKGFAKLRDHGMFRYWLYRIINNTFKSWLRKNKKMLCVRLTPEIQSGISGDSPIAQKATQRRLAAAMSGLSPKERALVTLYELEGWTLLELSKTAGKSVGSLKTKLSRIRVKMRKALMSHQHQEASAAELERSVVDALPYDS